jgi:hypothetical protein
MPRFTRRNRKTGEDIARISLIKDIGCICCRMEGLGVRGCEWHHLTEEGFTISHQDTVGLCQWHHRGICDEGRTSSMMKQIYGPSLAKGSVTFHKKYGSQEFLLGYQNELIEVQQRVQSIYH